ncbi:amino acid ABC transporter substrate-binding protein, PAAT family [Syntrophus gentianae]|uniref:Amino acid ABC transporter substrate-binding protein, PAAT family n=1 Tax=Syntrophus gentianae TaxID=43775 RepID=A0A1H7VXT4_9BACT|nr:amino acid ABC transporter substrate-binding protein [Syntrophus gentianae]SEM13679.1 amino acid ABC transporter substrate-binding protein, PAAT family [Syntrophus gentianae]
MKTVERFLVLSILAILLVLTVGVPPGFAGETLDAVKSRGILRCGVSEGIAGFSERNNAGRWTGLDVDFCRAVAAAVIGDPERVEFVPLKASARFPALQAGKIDLLVRNTTWTLGREAGLKVQFPGILFFDGQGFMVPEKKGVRKIEELNGAMVCVEKGTTHVQNLADSFAFRNMQVKTLVLDSVREVTDAFYSGRCRACTSDASQLAAMRLRAPGGPRAFVILPERISKEPLGPIVRRGDDDWFTIVRWVLFALITAEENNLTQDNIVALMRDSRHPVLRRAAGLEGGFGKALGLREGWAVRAVQAAGNYGEMFDRNLGRSSALQLDRGPNRLWTRGGLMYAPPLR